MFYYLFLNQNKTKHSFFLNVFKQHICVLSLVGLKQQIGCKLSLLRAFFSWFVFKLFWHLILLLWLEECFLALSSSDCLWMCVCEKKRTFLALSWKVTMILPLSLCSGDFVSCQVMTNVVSCFVCLTSKLTRQIACVCFCFYLDCGQTQGLVQDHVQTDPHGS